MRKQQSPMRERAAMPRENAAPDPLMPRAVTVDVRDAGEAIVASLMQAGIDHLFYSSGTELGFYQEAIAKAQAHGNAAPRLVMLTHEYVCLNAALGYAAVSGKAAVTAVHVDVGTQHMGGAIHTASRGDLPVLMTAGAPATSYPHSMTGSRDAPHFSACRARSSTGSSTPRASRPSTTLGCRVRRRPIPTACARSPSGSCAPRIRCLSPAAGAIPPRFRLS
jgi:hypothetical protein